MMLGDFNSHNPVWGGDHITPKGRVIENFISQSKIEKVPRGIRGERFMSF